MRHCIIIEKWQGEIRGNADFERLLEHPREAAQLHEPIRRDPSRNSAPEPPPPGPRMRGLRRCSRFDFLRIFFQGYRRETLLSVH